MRTHYIFTAALALALDSCSQGDEGAEVEARALTSSVGNGAMRAAPTGDRSATELFVKAKTDLRSLIRNSRFAIYELQLPGAEVETRVRSRAASVLGIEATAVTVTPHLNARNPVITARNGDLELSVNVQSGAELYEDTARFHRGKGIPKEALLPQVAYLEKAASYAETRLVSYVAGKDFYTYRLSTYYKGGGRVGEQESVDEPYQIVVVFNERIGGVPIIGPGGKLVVHLKHDGEVLAHRSTVVPIKNSIKALTEEDFLTPDEAKARATDRLGRSGLTLDDVTVERSELGYLRYNRNARQKYLAPHYAFFFKPQPDKGTKTLVEIVPAVKTPDLLALIESDRKADEERKAAIRSLTRATPRVTR